METYIEVEENNLKVNLIFHKSLNCFTSFCDFIFLHVYSANCVATKFSGKFVESASFSSSSSSISSSSSSILFILCWRDTDEVLLSSSPCGMSSGSWIWPSAAVPLSANCCEARKKCGSKKCVCGKNKI